MLPDFSGEYTDRSDDELLLLASDRASLTNEAAVALDAELNRRNLTKSDEAKYQKLVERNEQREARRRRRKMFGTSASRRSSMELVWALVTFVLILVGYFSLPDRFHLNDDWEESAVDAMLSSLCIAFAGRKWWRRGIFWLSLVISSAIHLLVVHTWVRRAGTFSKGEGKLAILLGLLLFFPVYGIVWAIRRNFYGQDTGEPPDDTQN